MEAIITEAKCPKCRGNMERRGGQFYWRGCFFSGLVCPSCNALYDDPTDSFQSHVGMSIGSHNRQMAKELGVEYEEGG